MIALVGLPLRSISPDDCASNILRAASTKRGSSLLRYAAALRGSTPPPGIPAFISLADKLFSAIIVHLAHS